MSIPIQVSPATNDLTLSKDQTLAEVVKVTIPKSGVVPKVDVYFLADTTNSMGEAIAAVKSGMVDILNQTQALGSDVWFGVGNNLWELIVPTDLSAFRRQNFFLMPTTR